ncbi:lipocalin-like domain-containing protein [Asaia prunellae]|uniref:lipocalin-like domain-containing protein n=1 Tax=Asaia prunellae TaxID=610245 RepID=UPI001FB19F4D|nr:lipocalin-like domain-containing protein [Asaia prunellae]
MEGEGRVPAHTDEDRAALLQTLVSYIGRFRIEGNAWITQIETAWVPEWVGSEQKRFVSIIDDIANVTTPWRHMPNWAPDKLTRSLIRFRRIV